MKIAIAGGHTKADFLIGSLKTQSHTIVVINDDKNLCANLAAVHKIPVIFGDPCKDYVLNEAYIENFDLLIALKPLDADNFAICQAARRIYGIKKAICTVMNPKNVELFQKLGVNTVISATYMVAQIIAKATQIDDFMDQLTEETLNLANHSDKEDR